VKVEMLAAGTFLVQNYRRVAIHEFANWMKWSETMKLPSTGKFYLDVDGRLIFQLA
jgi:hypothetical protein